MVVIAGVASTALMTNPAQPPLGPAELSFYGTALPGAEEDFSRVVYSSRGDVAAAAQADGRLLLWDMAASDEPRLRATLKANIIDSVSALAISDDSQTAAIADTHTILVVDTSTGRTLSSLTTEADSVVAMAFVSDAIRAVVVRPDRSLTARNFALDPELIAIPDTVTVQSEPFTSTAISTDGSYIATLTRTGYVRLWQVADREGSARELGTWTIHVKGRVAAIAINSHGTRLTVVDQEDGAQVWGIATDRAEVIGKVRTDSSVGAATMSPAGNSIVTAATDGGVEVWRSERYPFRLPGEDGGHSP